MTSTQVRVRARAVRSFSDAGTGEAYKKGQAVTLDEGVFENYRAAGLATAAEAKAAPESPSKSKAKAKASDKPADLPADTPEIPPQTQAE